MNFSIKWGILGNATIARKCVIPAIFSSVNGRIQALASRNPEEAQTLAEKYDITQLYSQYESVIEDKQVDVVYIPLPIAITFQICTGMVDRPVIIYLVIL